MKKIAAILLLLMLFFNWYGYRIVTAILTQSSDLQLEARIDNQEYDESQLIEVRIALSVPYQTSQSDFERHYGEVEVDGKYYTYVKSKVQDGFLVLKCIPNSEKEQIKKAGEDFYKQANGLDQHHPDKKGDNNNIAKSFWSEYDDRLTDLSIEKLAALFQKDFSATTSSLYDQYRPIPGQPPETVAVV